MNYALCTAPMMEWSDRHCRYLWRLISRKVVVFTEMITAQALIHGDRERLLAFDPSEQPVVLQLGGSKPRELALACKMAEERGYNAVDLNCGCPSDRVQGGNIGAILMRDPAQVARCYEAMRASCDLPISVKHRLGVDEQDEEESLFNFVSTVAEAGCSTFIVHARKAWLKGLSPKENREVPPLNYPLIYRLKSAMPSLTIILNGGVASLEQVAKHLEQVDGAMIGRAAYQNPFLLQPVDQQFFGQEPPHATREQVANAYATYIEQQQAEDPGLRLHHMTRHVLGLFHAQRGGKLYRRHLSENACRTGADVKVFQDALEHVLA